MAISGLLLWFCQLSIPAAARSSVLLDFSFSLFSVPVFSLLWFLSFIPILVCFVPSALGKNEICVSRREDSFNPRKSLYLLPFFFISYKYLFPTNETLKSTVFWECYAVKSGRRLATFRRNTPPLSSGSNTHQADNCTS